MLQPTFSPQLRSAYIRSRFFFWNLEVESNDFCRKILTQRAAEKLLPQAPIFGDVTTFDIASVHGADAPVTGLLAGFPCQARVMFLWLNMLHFFQMCQGVSKAGRKKGLKDDRTKLFKHCWRVWDAASPELILNSNNMFVVVCPSSALLRKWMWLENVVNLLSLDLREVFQYICEDCYLCMTSFIVTLIPLPGVCKAWPGATLGFRQWKGNWGTCWSLRTVTSQNIATFIYVNVSTKVWRERCFLLINVRGYNFFKAQWVWWHIADLITPIPGPATPLQSRDEANANIAVDAVEHTACCGGMAASNHDWDHEKALSCAWQCGGAPYGSLRGQCPFPAGSPGFNSKPSHLGVLGCHPNLIGSSCAWFEWFELIWRNWQFMLTYPFHWERRGTKKWKRITCCQCILEFDCSILKPLCIIQHNCDLKSFCHCDLSFSFFGPWSRSGLRAWTCPRPTDTFGLSSHNQWNHTPKIDRIGLAQTKLWIRDHSLESETFRLST